jgi:hypothetical protein
MRLLHYKYGSHACTQRGGQYKKTQRKKKKKNLETTLSSSQPPPAAPVDIHPSSTITRTTPLSSQPLPAKNTRFLPHGQPNLRSHHPYSLKKLGRGRDLWRGDANQFTLPANTVEATNFSPHRDQPCTSHPFFATATNTT